MIIDCHYHLEPRLQPVEDLLRQMDQYEIERTVLMAAMLDPLPHTPNHIQYLLRFLLTHSSLRFLAKRLITRFTPEGNIKLPAGVFKIYREPDNTPVFQTVEAYSDRFWGWVFVNPRGQKPALAEYELWRRHWGFVGVKAHPCWHCYPPSELIPIAEKLEQDRKPLLIHAGFDTHGDYQPLLNAVPNLKLILAHAGFPLFAQTWNHIRQFNNVYVDLSQSVYLDEKITRQAAAAVGVDRCLFGTDGPYGELNAQGMFDNGFLKRRIERLFPDQQIRQRLLGENFQELLEN